MHRTITSEREKNVLYRCITPIATLAYTQLYILFGRIRRRKYQGVPRMGSPLTPGGIILNGVVDLTEMLQQCAMLFVLAKTEAPFVDHHVLVFERSSDKPNLDALFPTLLR